MALPKVDITDAVVWVRAKASVRKVSSISRHPQHFEQLAGFVGHVRLQQDTADSEILRVEIDDETKTGLVDR